MFTLIRTRTLRAMQSAVESLADELDMAAAELAETETEATRLRVELEALANEVGGRAAFIYEAVTSPENGETIRAAIALAMVRHHIDVVHAMGTPEQIAEVHVLDVILGRSPQDNRPAADLSTGQLRDGASIRQEANTL